MSEYQGSSGNEFHTSLDFDNMLTRPNSNEYEILCYFPETIIIVKDMWVRVNGLDNVMPIRTGLSREGTNRYREIDFALKHNILFNQDAHKKLEEFLHKQNCIAHGNNFNLANTDILIRNNFSLVAFPPPVIPRLNSGTGSRTSSAKNTYTDQEISSMSAIQRVAHMLYLALSKMNVAVADLFTIEDLAIVAALLLVLQVTPEGWALDTALLGMAFAYAWFDGIKSVSLLVRAVSMAASANNNAEIDQAATMAAKGAVHLGLDLIIAFIVHRQIGTVKDVAPTTAAKKAETTNPDEYEKVEFGKKEEIPTAREIVKGSFAPQGMSAGEARNFLENNSMGQKMLDEVIKGQPNLSLEDAKSKVLETLRSGSNLPTENILKDGVIYKLQPPEYSSVLPSTPYLISPEHYEQALQMAKQQGTTLDQVLGLPENSVRGDYSLWKMTTNQPTTVFTNTIAPTQETVIQNGIEQVIQKPGGAVQDLLLNHNSFQQELMGTISNSPK